MFGQTLVFSNGFQKPFHGLDGAFHSFRDSTADLRSMPHEINVGLIRNRHGSNLDARYAKNWFCECPYSVFARLIHDSTLSVKYKNITHGVRAWIRQSPGSSHSKYAPICHVSRPYFEHASFMHVAPFGQQRLGASCSHVPPIWALEIHSKSPFKRLKWALYTLKRVLYTLEVPWI